MEDDEYELVSSEEVDRLKREIAHLKANPFVQNSSDDRLYDAVRNLNESVTKLYVLFENINKQLMKEYQSEDSPEAKLDKILEQNRNIAEALVTFVSKNEQAGDSQASSPEEAQADIPMPAMQQPMQIKTPLPPDPFVGNQRNASQNVSQFQGMSKNLNQTQTAQMQRFNQTAQQIPNGQAQMQAPIQQQKFSFNSKLDPNYPTPDNMPGLNEAPSFGAPLDIEPKKKSFLNFGKK